jgi:hypothetical protein
MLLHSEHRYLLINIEFVHHYKTHSIKRVIYIFLSLYFILYYDCRIVEKYLFITSYLMFFRVVNEFTIEKGT